jgi:hypothetical protein
MTSLTLRLAYSLTWVFLCPACGSTSDDGTNVQVNTPISR